LDEEDRDETIKHIAKILRRTLKFNKKPDWIGDPIDISWMREAGFDKIWTNDIFDSLLVFGTKTCDIKHFEDFRRIYNADKSPDEWVIIANKLSDMNNKKLPSFTWLKNNNYINLFVMIQRYPEKFAHLEREYEHKTHEELLELAKSLVNINNGKLQNYKWLEDNHPNLINCMMKHPNLFVHFERETMLNTPDENLEIAKRLSKENNGILQCHKWLNKNKYSKISAAIYNHPEIFKGIRMEMYKGRTKFVITIGEESNAT